MAYHVKISLSKLCCEDGWQQRDIPGLKPQPCILTTNASVPQRSPVPSLAAWAPLVGQSGPAPGAQCWEKRKTQRKVAKATGEQWRLLWKAIYESEGLPVCFLSGPSRLLGVHGGCKCHPLPVLTLSWGGPLGSGHHCCHPPLSGQRQPRALLGFSCLSSLDHKNITLQSPKESQGSFRPNTLL